MTHQHSRLGHQRLQLEGHGLDGGDPVVQEVHLTAPVQLALDGVADHALVVVAHEGLHRQAVLRRRFESAEVPGSGEGQVQGARDGGRAESQHIDGAAQQLELLLVLHPELLLLVHDDQPQVPEDHVGRHDPVRADDDVHRSGGRRLHHGLLLLGRAETAHQFDAHRILRHALAEMVVVLLGQHRGGHQQGHLLAAHDRLEGRPDGHLGLAEADVSADQAVHRLGQFHVGLGGRDGPDLIGSLLELETGLEFPLPRRVAREGMPRLGGPGRLHRQQFGRQIPDRPLGLLLGLGPAGAADGAELRPRLAGTDVLAHQVRLGHRHVELRRLVVSGARGVFDHQAFLAATRGPRLSRWQGLETAVDPDAVLEMDDVVAQIELREIDLEGIAHRLRVVRLQPARARHLVPPVDLGIRDHHASGRFAEESPRKRARQDLGNPPRSGVARSRGQQLPPQFSETLDLAGIVAEHLEMVALTQPPLQLLEEGAPLLLGDLGRRQGRPDGPECIERFEHHPLSTASRARGVVRVFEPDPGCAGGLGPQLQRRPRLMEGIAFAHLVGMVLRLEGQGLGSAQDDHRIGSPMRVEGDHRRGRRLGTRLGPQQTQLAGRRNHTGIDGLEPGLTLRVEFAQRFQLVTEELQPDRPRPGEGPEIHDAATPGQLALVGDLGLRFVALRFEPFDEIQRVDGVAPTQRPGPGFEVGRSEGPLLDGGHRGHHEPAHPRNPGLRSQGDQGLEALTDDVGVRQSGFLRQRLPGREELGPLPIQPGGRIGMQLFLCFQGVGDGHDRAVRTQPMQHGHQPRAGRRGHAFEAHRTAGRDPLAQHLDGRRCQPALQHGGGNGIQARKAYRQTVEWRFWN